MTVIDEKHFQDLPDWALRFDPEETVELLNQLLAHHKNGNAFALSDFGFHPAKLSQVFQSFEKEEVLKTNGNYYKTTEDFPEYIEDTKDHLESILEE